MAELEAITTESVEDEPVEFEHPACVCGCPGPRKLFHLKKPEYVADVSTGYLQTKAGIYYKGHADLKLCGPNDTAYFLLYNPDCSGVNVLISKTFLANLSDAPLKAVTYLCAKPKGCLEESFNITNTNTYLCCTDSKAKIFSGKNLQLIRGTSHLIYTVKEYDTFVGTPDGNLLLAPGQYYIVEVRSLPTCPPPVPGKPNSSVCSFAWWEEPFHVC